MKRVVCVAIFAVLILAGCSGSQGVSNLTATPIGSGTAITETPAPSPVVQAECPKPTACPGPTACPSAPGCPEPVTCPTCAEPVTCPTCPEPVTCPPAVTCPEETACAADDIHSPARANLEACKVQLALSTSMLTDCQAGYNSYKAALDECNTNLESSDAYVEAWECRAICEQTNCCGCGGIDPSCVLQSGSCMDYCPDWPQ